MKCLHRNKQKFYYCQFISNVKVQDEQGNYTGELKPTYGEAIELYANISSEKGTSQLETFGNFEDYDSVIVVDDKNCPINENSVLFIGVQPSYDSDLVPQFNYIVKRVSRSLNSSAYAVSKVR